MVDALKLVEEHGVVLASARGPVPSIAEAVAGEPIRGSWWAHPKGTEIFNALNEVDDSPDVLCFRLVLGKVTFVHRRLWPALVCLADELGRDRLTAVKQEHTESGAHRNVETPFPQWVPAEVARAAKALAPDDARQQLGAWVDGKAAAKRPRKPPAKRPGRPRGRK
jgi:hypothetical protein